MAREVGEPIPAADPTYIRTKPRTEREKMATFAMRLGVDGYDRMDEAQLRTAIKDKLNGNPGNISAGQAQ
jgi:hypothetical protein